MAVVRVRIERSPDGPITAFTVDGHSGSGPRGRDIVCAGVSALTQTAVLGLERRLHLAVDVEASAGLLVCRLPSGLEDPLLGRAQDVLETMRIGLCAMAAAHPGHVRVFDRGGA